MDSSTQPKHSGKEVVKLVDEIGSYELMDEDNKKMLEKVSMKKFLGQL